MKIRTGSKLSIVVSVLLLATSQMSPVQAADNYFSSQDYAQPNDATMGQQPQYALGYGAPDYSNPGYGQRSYDGRRNYGHNSGANYWGDSGPGFSSPRDSGRGGSNMPWSSGRSGRGGSNMPWNSDFCSNNMPWN